VDPVDAVATSIQLSIYSDGWGELLDSMEVETEGPVVIDVEETDPYSDPPEYYIYAHADGFYTELYHCSKGDTIDVDLDAVPELEGAFTGVIFATQSFFSDSYFSGRDIEVTGPGGISTTIRTDGQGRYGLSAMPTGGYTLRFTHQDEPFSFSITSGEGTDYDDLYFAEPMQAAAPNIYLYPTEETDVSVTLGFPSGGHVTVSTPEYGDGWDVRVTPDGTIDGTHGYLFYEASVIPALTLDEGWVVDGADLEGGLRGLLSSYGFAGREIDDFVDFWVPELEGHPHYVLYPQDPELVSTLTIDPAPDSILRMILVIRPLAAPVSLPEPLVEPFDRTGFTVVEWGVLRAMP
jgi:hypothetical protein